MSILYLKSILSINSSKLFYFSINSLYFLFRIFPIDFFLGWGLGTLIICLVFFFLVVVDSDIFKYICLSQILSSTSV